MIEKTSRGTPGDQAQVWVTPEIGKSYLLPHVVIHSPTPGKHGDFRSYGGSGPVDGSASC